MADGNTMRVGLSNTAGEATLILDSGGTSHMVGESAAGELESDVVIRPVHTNIQLGEQGKL